MEKGRELCLMDEQGEEDIIIEANKDALLVTRKAPSSQASTKKGLEGEYLPRQVHNLRES